MTWTPRTLAEFVAERARDRADAEALVTPTARLTYAEQYRAVRRTAKAMHALGVRQGDFVGILMGNDETWVTLFYAAAMLGAVTVPVNTRFKSAELAFCLKQADVKASVHRRPLPQHRFPVVPARSGARRRPCTPRHRPALAGTRRRHRQRCPEGGTQLRGFYRARGRRQRRHARHARREGNPE